MKKIFVFILSMMLIFSLCACVANKSQSPDLPSEDSSQGDSGNEVDLPDEEPFEESGGTNSKNDVIDGERGYEAFHDARMAFDNYIIDNSPAEETIMHSQSLVLIPDIEIFDYITPLIYWGETLEDGELAQKDIVMSVFTGEGKRFISADLQRESANKYTMTIDKDEGGQIFIQVDYRSDIDALRLEADDSGERALLFEYIRTDDGYAAQYYFSTAVGSTYGEGLTKAMCVFRTIFSGNNGSYARFDDVDEPATILDGVPDEQEFIDGATHWLTVKDNKFTGELKGTAF